MIDIPSQTVENSILEELYDNMEQYSQFHEGTNRKILQDAEQFFKEPLLMYATDIVDVIVCAAANALETNFAIFQNIGGKAVIIYTNCSKIATNRTIYLKFDYYPGKSGNNHYTAIVDDTGVKPTPAVKEVNTEQPNYEPITPSPTTPTRSPEDCINIMDASTILAHDVNLTAEVLEDLIEEKRQRTKKKISIEKGGGTEWICHY